MPPASERTDASAITTIEASQPIDDVTPADDTYRAALSLIAHELRSPAAVVSGYLRMLLQSELSGLTDRQRRMLEQSSVSCTRMLRLIQELGELTALESSEPVKTSGIAIFSLCDAAVAAAATEQNRPSPVFMCADADRAVTVDGDAGWLKRAIGALVEATARELGTDQLECFCFVDGDLNAPEAIIALGPPGLRASRDALVSNRARFDRWRGGTGLSVPIACRIIEAHGGDIWMARRGDSRFVCVWTLPISKPSPGDI
jgi:signal transduction histidine kinase